MKINKVIPIILMSFISTSALAFTGTVSKDVVEQKRGNYPPMKRRESVPVGAIQRAMDDAKGGVYGVEYDPEETIKVRMRESIDTSVVLPDWEEIQHVEVGNEGFIRAFKSKKNQVMLKTLEIGVDTSVTIIGHNTYRLYVRTEGYNSKNIPDIGVNISAYPPRHIFANAKGANTKEEIKDWLAMPIPVPPEGIDIEFSMSGDREIAPEFVYSDGTRTWLRYGDKLDKGNLPVVFLVEDGVDTPINTNVIGKSIVVSGTGILTLRNGVKTVCVYPTKLGRHKREKKK